MYFNLYFLIDDLRNYLKHEGEVVTNEELDECLALLVGDDGSKVFKHPVNSDEFAEVILGFEEVDEEEDYENSGEETQAMAAGQ